MMFNLEAGSFVAEMTKLLVRKNLFGSIKREWVKSFWLLTAHELLEFDSIDSVYQAQQLFKAYIQADKYAAAKWKPSATVSYQM